MKRALDDAMRDINEAENCEWRPRRAAATIRRLGQLGAAIERTSVKPPPP
jgi:hypothetical protein